MNRSHHRPAHVALHLLCLAGASPAAADDAWTIVRVPGAWESQVDGRFAQHDGFAWYRAYVKVTDDMVENPRPLWPESVTVAVSGVADAHEVYLNGVRLGGAGSFPPGVASGRDVVRRYKVKRGILERGVYNCLAIRVHNAAGEGGLVGPPPVIAGYELEWVLEGPWEFRTGDNLAWAAGPLAAKPAAAGYDSPREALTPLAPTEELFHGKKLAPEESLARMRVPDDLEVELALAEPAIGQPLFLSWDERGRLWVTQYRQYPYPAGVRMVSRNKYYRAVYDRAPDPPPRGERGADRITIHEDTDGDGRYDVHKTFVDGLNLATSAVRGHGGVWVICSPYLLFYRDADGDDVPDADPEVRLSGFGLEDSHSLNNSLRWGPEGWLYGVQGCNLVSHVRLGLPAADASAAPAALYVEGPVVWRYRGSPEAYEVFAEGGGNIFGLELDGAGRIYSGHNGSETRGFHYVQGAYFEKGTEVKFGPVSNPHAFGTLPGMASGTVSRFTHTFVRYEGGALPERYRDRLLLVDPLAQKVLTSAIEPRGSSFATKDLPPALETDDPAFRPVEIKIGPDGDVYIADLCEEYIAHGQHYQGQIDPTSGRIWRLRAKGAPRRKTESLEALPAAALVDRLSSASKWHRETALRLLGERRDRAIEPRLREMLRDPGPGPGPGAALNAFWALVQLGALDEALARQALEHSLAAVRHWSVRLVGDARRASPPLAERLRDLARYETDAEVRCQLAASARRLPAADALPILNELLRRDEDAQDPYLPLMLWWAVEAHVAADRAGVLGLLEPPATWARPLASTLPAKLARRFALGGTQDDLLACAQLFRRAPGKGDVEALLAAFELAFQGRAVPALPRELIEAMAERGAAGSLGLRVRRGVPGATEEALALLRDEKQPLEKRLEVVQLLGEIRHEPAVTALQALALVDSNAPEALRLAALSSLGRYEDAGIATAILAAHAALPEAVRTAAESLLASRVAWSRALLDAVRAGRLTAGSLSRDAVRKMLLHPDERLAAALRELRGDVQGTDTEAMQAEIARVEAALAGGLGDPYAGKRLFTPLCGRCHVLFREGGKVGPDLSPYNRHDTRAMLIHIVQPSAEIREGFETRVAVLEDGRIVTGFLADQDSRVVILRGQDGQSVTLERAGILSLERDGQSVMPEGLLAPLKEQELRDLFAYLRVSQPMTP